MADLARSKAMAAAADAKQGTGGLLTTKVDKAAQAMMRTKVNPNQVWAVIGLVDRSGSMYYEYENGTVQEIVNRMLAFSVIVDDDGSVPTIFFGSDISNVEIKLDDFHNYLKRHRISASGGTPLTQALEELARESGNADVIPGGFLRRAVSGNPQPRKATTPTYAIIVTDGAPNDRDGARELVRRLSFRGVFIKILFVGDDAVGWDYVDKLDRDLPGRLVDNVNTQNMGDVKKMTDEQFYEAMFAEVKDWLPAARKAGLIN